MLISKYTDKNGKVNVSIVIHKSFLKECKNEKYVRLTLAEDFLVGLDEKKQIQLNKIIDVKKLTDNTSK